MRLSPSRTLVAPSVPLLRFLRQQAAHLTFFTPNLARPASHSRRARPCSVHPRQHVQSFTTTPGSPLEASLLPIGLPSKLRELQPSVLVSSFRTTANDPRARRLPHGRPASQGADGRALWWQQLKNRIRPFEGKEHRWPYCDSPTGLFENDGSALLGRVKAPNELKLRCTELDENGKVTVVDGEFKKTEIISRVRAAQSPQRKLRRTRGLIGGPARPYSSACCRATCARSTRPCCPRSSCARA